MGWIAEKYPEVIRKIDSAGHEMGIHSYYQQLVYEQSQDEFRIDVQKAIKVLEDITGKKVKTYRAPGFSITESNI